MEKEIANLSSILAPQTKELVGYSPWGCKRVAHDLGTKQCSDIFHNTPQMKVTQMSLN